MSVQAQLKKNEITKGLYLIDNFLDGTGSTNILTIRPRYPNIQYFRHFDNGFSASAGVIIGGGDYLKKNTNAPYSINGRRYTLWSLGAEKRLYQYKNLQILCATGLVGRSGYETCNDVMDCLFDGRMYRALGGSAGVKLKVYIWQQMSLNADLNYYQFGKKAVSPQHLLSNFSVGYRF
jgi:hypothetical protein